MVNRSPWWPKKIFLSPQGRSTHRLSRVSIVIWSWNCFSINAYLKHTLWENGQWILWLADALGNQIELIISNSINRMLICIGFFPHNYSETVKVVVWCSGNVLVSINVVILCRARLVLGWVTFMSSNHVHTLSVFNQPPKPTQPGHSPGVGKMSTSVKTGKVTAGYGRGVVYCP